MADGKTEARVGTTWRNAVPIGVAVVGALVIGAGVDTIHRHPWSPKKKAATNAKSTAATQNSGGRPRFVVGVRRDGDAVVVRDVKTGGDVGLPVAAPAGRSFQRIAAGPGDSYVVASYGTRKVMFHRLVLGKDGRPSTLSDIPRAVVPGVSNPSSDMAVTPDGTTIAYVTYRKGGAGTLDVLSTRSGTRKTWKAKPGARIGSLSWAGPTLSFLWSPQPRAGVRGAPPAPAPPQVRTLNTAGPAGDLKLSKPVLRLPAGTEAAVLTPDGRTIVAGVGSPSRVALQQFSTATGRPGRVLWEHQGKGGVSRLDSDSSGGHLLLAGDDGSLYGPDERTPVPGDDLSDVAW
ncbi:PD40 domain-containing protein [Actinomadura oligospora]|uniref:PD40 domain-containing protein n=1 Tax=Actinomadura oligospora TaxID=111804 RepID=UPI000479AE24|nr:PD40 domain-containing protein [Actinomadura oligospora]